MFKTFVLATCSVRDVNQKQQVQLTANEAQGAIKRLMDATKVEKAVGSEEFDDAFAILSDDAAELEQARRVRRVASCFVSDARSRRRRWRRSSAVCGQRANRRKRRWRR